MMTKGINNRYMIIYCNRSESLIAGMKLITAKEQKINTEEKAPDKMALAKFMIFIIFIGTIVSGII